MISRRDGFQPLAECRLQLGRCHIGW